MAPSGTLLQLGAKRAASVLWKAVVKGDRKGVELIFAKFAFSQEARDAVASAKNVLKAEGNLQVFMANLRYFKEVLAKLRTEGAVA